MLLEWEFSAKERTYLEKLDIPQNVVRKAKEVGIRLEDGARIPVEIQKLIQDAESVRIELL